MGPAAILSVLVNADTQQATERLSKYDRQLREVQGVARHGVETRLGASFDPKAFAAYEARLSQAARRAKDRAAFRAELGASFNNAGFNAYERAVEKARRESQQLAASQEAAQSRMRRAASSFFKSGSNTEQRSFVRGTVRGAVGRGAGFLGGGILGGLAGYASADAIKSAIDGTKELAKETQFLTQVTGMDTKTASEWIAVAQSRGVNAQALNVGFRTLSKGAEAALTGTTKAVAKTYDTLAAKTESALQGSKASIKAFQALGISQGDVASRQHDMAGLTQLVTDRLAGMRDGIEKTTLSNKLLGKSSSSTMAAAKAFRELGIDQRDLAAHSHDLSGLLGLVADRLDRMRGGTRKTAIEAALLGRNAAALNPILSEGSKAMEEQRKQAAAYGVALGGNTIANANKLRDASENLKLAQIGLSVQFTEHVAPALIKVTTGAIKLAVAIGHEMTPVFKTLSPILKDTGHWLAAHKTIIEGLVVAFVGLKIVKVVGGWFLGLYNDAKKVIDFGSTIIGMFSKQGAAASEEAVQINELAAAYERLALAQKETGGVAPMLGGAGPAVAREGTVAAEGAGAGLAARGALATAGKVFLPLTAVMGLFSAVSGKGGGVGGFAGRFLSGATMGLIPSSVFASPTNAHQRQQGTGRGDASFAGFAASRQGTAAGQRVLTGQGVEQYTRRLQQLNKQIDDNAVHKVYDSVHHEWVQIAGDQKVVLDRQAQLNTLTKNFAREQAGATPVIEANVRALMGGSKFQSAGSVFKAIVPELDKLTGKFQNAGAMSALAYARSLERNGRLPRGATDKLIRDLESKFPSFAAYLGREGVTGMRSLANALDVRHLQGRAAALINSFRRTFGWLPTYAGTAGRSTEQKMRSAMVALRGIIATGSAAQRAAAIPMLRKLVADYQGYMAELKTASADAERSARGSIRRLGGDWEHLGSVIETVVDKMILPSVNAAAGAINGLLGVSKRLPQTAETQQQLQHAATAARLGVRPNTATTPSAGVRSVVQHGTTAHHAAAPWSAASGSARRAGGATMRYYHHHPIGKMTEAQYQAWLAAHAPSAAGGSGAGRATMRYFNHHPIGKMTTAQYQAWLAAHARSVTAAQNATAALGTAPSQSVAAQIQMAALANTLQIAQNDQNIPAQQKALSAELRLEKAWMGEDKRRLARIVRMLKARDLSRAKRSQLQQARLSILQEIGNVAGQMSSTMSSLSGLGGSTGTFDLAPTGANVQLPTVYDVRRAIGPRHHAAIHKGANPTHETHVGGVTIYISENVDVDKAVDKLDRVINGNLSAHIRRAGMRGI